MKSLGQSTQAQISSKVLRPLALTARSGVRATGVGRDACLGPLEMARRGKKKHCDPFLGKERYDRQAPCMRGARSRSKNLVSRMHGSETALEELKVLATELNLADHEQRAQPGSARRLSSSPPGHSESNRRRNSATD